MDHIGRRRMIGDLLFDACFSVLLPDACSSVLLPCLSDKDVCEDSGDYGS